MTKKAKSNKKRKRTIQSQTRDEGNNYLMTRREIVKKWPICRKIQDGEILRLRSPSYADYITPQVVQHSGTRAEVTSIKNGRTGINVDVFDDKRFNSRMQRNRSG